MARFERFEPNIDDNFVSELASLIVPLLVVKSAGELFLEESINSDEIRALKRKIRRGQGSQVDRVTVVGGVEREGVSGTLVCVGAKVKK